MHHTKMFEYILYSCLITIITETNDFTIQKNQSYECVTELGHKLYGTFRKISTYNFINFLQ